MKSNLAVVFHLTLAEDQHILSAAGCLLPNGHTPGELRWFPAKPDPNAPVSEAEIVHSLSEQCDSAKAIITFGGRKHTIPALIHRALKYGIALPWFYGGRRSCCRDTREPAAVHIDLAADLHIETSLEAYISGIIGPVTTAADSAHSATLLTALLLRWFLVRGDMTREQYASDVSTLFDVAAAQGVGFSRGE